MAATPDEVAAFLATLELDAFPPRYNIAPTQPILMAIAAPPREPGSNLPDRAALLVRWGLIPSWCKDPKALPLLINARSETAAEKNAFRAAMRHRRALIPATGFYEWKRDGKARQAYLIRPKGGGLMAFGALMETFADPGGSEIDTGAILTTAANDQIAAIHDRMPVVIRPADFARWLDCRTQEPRDVADLLAPVEHGFFEAIAISDKVNKVANTGPDILEPIAVAQPAPQPADKPKAAGKPAPADQLKLF